MEQSAVFITARPAVTTADFVFVVSGAAAIPDASMIG